MSTPTAALAEARTVTEHLAVSVQTGASIDTAWATDRIRTAVANVTSIGLRDGTALLGLLVDSPLTMDQRRELSNLVNAKIVLGDGYDWQEGRTKLQVCKTFYKYLTDDTAGVNRLIPNQGG